jgi:hypothetical protein
MKQKPDPETPWQKLVARAREDASPPIDRAALHRAVREFAPQTADGGAADFLAGMATRRVLSGCLAGAGACAVLASWQAWETWQALPWAQWLATTTGGMP